MVKGMRTEPRVLLSPLRGCGHSPDLNCGLTPTARCYRHFVAIIQAVRLAFSVRQRLAELASPAPKVRQHLAVGVSPQNQHTQRPEPRRGGSNGRQSVLLSLFRGCEPSPELNCGLTPSARCYRHSVADAHATFDTEAYS